MKLLKNNSFGLLLILLCFICSSRQTLSQQTVQKQIKISKLNFTGNEYFSSDQIQNMLVLKPEAEFTRDQFDLDLKNIIVNYRREGFLECKISDVNEEYNFDSSYITLTIKINEGPRVFIGEILFEGNKYYTSATLLKMMYTKTGKTLDAGTLNQDIEQILNKYEQNGFAFATITVKDISAYTDKGMEKLRIKIKVNENEKIKIDKIVINGNTFTNEDVILREIRLDSKSIVTRENMLDIKSRLENLGYFESVEQPKIMKYKNSTVLFIQLKEGNTNTFDGIIGYNPPVTNEAKGYFTGLINLSLRNLFGTGRRIDARWQKEIQSTQELELKYQEPWFLGYPLNLNLAFLQRIQDSTYTKRFLGFQADALISKHITASVTIGLERVIPSISSGGVSYYPVFDSRTLSAGVELKFDNRDYIYNPSKGILYRVSYSIGQKKIYNFSFFNYLNIPPDFTVQRGSMDLDFYYSFFNRQSSLISLHGANVTSPKLEDADYFRIGGNSSVRGYREEQFLASLAAWANLELRYSLTRKSFASIFYDLGYYSKPSNDLAGTPGQKAFIYGYGLGVRVETGLGIFGVSYALAKGSGILDGIIHFGLINDF